MTTRISRTDLEQSGEVVAEPRTVRSLAERPFGLHPALFAATIGAYVAFLTIMAATFRTEGLILPFAICFIYLTMAFGVPALWSRMGLRPDGRYQSWVEFRADGMKIQTGQISASAVTAQVLILPVLLLVWAMAIAIIVAAVSVGL